jgi:hypothetical protein
MTWLDLARAGAKSIPHVKSAKSAKSPLAGLTPNGSSSTFGTFGTDALLAVQATVPAAYEAPNSEARARGWQVELHPSGWLVETGGGPSDPGLMNRLHAALLATDREAARWPAAVTDDPGEVVLHGTLDEIEREAGQ